MATKKEKLQEFVSGLSDGDKDELRTALGVKDTGDADLKETVIAMGAEIAELKKLIAGKSLEIPLDDKKEKGSLLSGLSKLFE